MKKIWFLSLFLLTLFLISCTPSFPKVKSFFISPFELTADEKKFYTSLALSPDGKTMAVASVGEISLANLVTGNRDDFDNRFGVRENITLANHDLLFTFVNWSFDGRYVGIPADHYEPTSKSPVGRVLYIFDMQKNTFNRYEVWGEFSPFNSDQVATNEGVYNLKNQTTIPFSVDFNFMQEKEFGVTYLFDTLWSRSLGVPVAELRTLPYDAPNNVDAEIAVESFNPTDPRNPKYSIPIGFTSRRPNQLAGMFFDPSGEYVLVVEWQCAANSPTPCGITPIYTENVYDSVLTLVQWRTGEQKELIKLSDIDPEHVVAKGYMAWSADGSTIYISRLDAEPVILKLK